MPIYAGKNLQYAHFAEICKKMQQHAKYAAITYSCITGMPNWRCRLLQIDLCNGCKMGSWLMSY